jgi:hypothetical protein
MRLAIVALTILLLWTAGGCDCFSREEFKIATNSALPRETALDATQAQVHRILDDTAHQYKLEPVAPQVVLAHSFIEYRNSHGEVGLAGRRIGQDIFIDATLWNPGCNPFIGHRFNVLVDHLKDALKKNFGTGFIQLPPGKQMPLNK